MVAKRLGSRHRLCRLNCFLYCLHELGARRPNHILKVKTGLDQLLDRSLFGIQSLIHMARLVHVEVKDLLFDYLRIFAFKRVTLIKYEVDTASKCPNVNFLAKTALLEDELWGRIVHMATEIAPSEQFLEVVW